MLKVVAKRHLLPGVKEAYFSLVKPLVEQTRQEPGCIDYALCYNEAENTAAMIETWQDEAALDAHLQKLRASEFPAKMNALTDMTRASAPEKYSFIY